jgi:hypothetical protein
VTGVDSTAKLDMLRSISADHVVDYTQEAFTQNSKSYDVIFDPRDHSPSLIRITEMRVRLRSRILAINP